MASRIAAPVLIAVLAAAFQGAWAEDGPPPFPGVAAETRQAGAAEEAPGSAPDTATAEAAPEGPGEPAATAGGSRLLRALAGSPGRDDMRARDRAPVMAAEGCPRGLLRRLLAGAAGEADALSALGIESEILTLCRERQEILTGLFEAEAALRELRTPLDAPAAPPEPAARAGEAAAVQPVLPVRAAGLSSLRAALAAEGKKADEVETRAADTHAADTRAAEPRAPRYAWFSIVGAAGALRAGVTDGSGVWFVREGDPLPGGVTVAAIAARPPGVRVTGGGGNGGAVLLPYAGASVPGTSVSGMSVPAGPGGGP